MWVGRARPGPQEAEADTGHCGPVTKVKIVSMCLKKKKKKGVVPASAKGSSALAGPRLALSPPGGIPFSVSVVKSDGVA